MCKGESGLYSATEPENVIITWENGEKYVNGFPTKLQKDKQGKHIPGHKNFIPGKSELTISMKEAEKLIQEKSGTGVFPNPKGNKEIVTFDHNIGVWVDSDDPPIRLPTNKGTIHYSKNGTHIVPAHP